MLSVLARSAGPYAVNTILVWCERTRQAALFDPSGESETTITEMKKKNLCLAYLVNTHGHLDHIAENGVIKSYLDVPLLIHERDRAMLTDPSLNLSAFTGHPIVSPDADRTIDDEEELVIGDEVLKAIHVPGHTLGSLVFFQPGLLISGDTLFCGGVGRTDFPNGSERELFTNIRTRIYTLPDDTVVYPGHGPTTTVGEERRTNPFVRG